MFMDFYESPLHTQHGILSDTRTAERKCCYLAVVVLSFSPQATFKNIAVNPFACRTRRVAKFCRRSHILRLVESFWQCVVKYVHPVFLGENLAVYTGCNPAAWKVSIAIYGMLYKHITYSHCIDKILSCAS